MPNQTEYDSGSVRLTNLIALLSALGTFFIFVVLIYFFGWPRESNRWYLVATIPVYLAIPIINKAGRHTFAKYLMCYTPVVFCFVVSIVNKKIGPIFINDYYVFRMVLITASIVPILIFKHNQYLHLFFCAAPAFLGLVLFDPIHNLAGVGIFGTGYEDDTYFMTTFTSAVCYLALAGFIYALKRKNDIYFLNINVQKEQLSKQNRSLEDLNKQVESRNLIILKQNEQLKDVSSLLQKKVAKRTKELTSLNKELAAQNVKLEQFTFITAHNLKSPVTQIKGLLNLMNYEMITEHSREILNMMLLSCTNLEEVIADLNKILNIKNGSYIIESLNLAEIVDHILLNLKPDIGRSNIVVKRNYGAVVEVASIKAFVYSVFFNLIQNAIKYHDPEKEDSFILVDINEEKSSIHIVIEDNGIGFEHSAVKEKVFQLYQRFHTNVQGKGMGLFLVKTQLEMIRGNIDVKSEEGQGTRFEIKMPKTLTPDYEPHHN